ncbi:hypothetical protein [Prochlorococcus marinus]|nr:hypothetical protein [Prochlorococcus marinus]
MTKKKFHNSPKTTEKVKSDGAKGMIVGGTILALTSIFVLAIIIKTKLL